MKYNHKIAVSVLLSMSVLLLTLSFFNLTTKKFTTNYLTQTVGEEFNKELQCLAENIYYEAGSESFEGKAAVAQVTINRANSGKFKSTICGVVKQKDIINGLTICQFSWFCEPIKTALKNSYRWEESVIVAKKALTEPKIHDMIYRTDAMYYHNTSVNPNWGLHKVTKIGNHIFYKKI